MGGSETFQIRHYGKVGCLDISQQKAKQLLQGTFLTCISFLTCINQGVKHCLFWSKYSLEVVKLKDSEIKQGGFKAF